MRIILAGIAGAIAMFVWTSIAHVATPLARIGISQIPNEQPVLDAMHSSIGAKPGLYFFPWVDPKDPNMMKLEAERMKTNPSGILIYTPAGASGEMTGELISEFVKEFATALIAAWLLSMTVLSSYVGRVGFVAAVGAAAALTTNFSYWIWYKFPLSYTLSYGFIDFVAYVAAGLAIAAVLKPRAA